MHESRNLKRSLLIEMLYYNGFEPKQVQEVCQKWLQQTFSDVHEVITKDGLRKAFLQLCPQAVILWMKCDDLMGTENDVAFLVTRWHVGKQVKRRRCQKGL
eukprot:scaffold252149_cov14-Tisochrysis_lutea.AAC.1